MARVLKTYKASPRKRGPKPKYPWDRWLDGRIWKLTKGDDFQCSLATMEDNVRKAARREDVAVIVHRDEEAEAIVIDPQ